MSETPRSRSRSRSKRSTTDLSNLRLAPLSAKFSETTNSSTAPTLKTPSTETPDVAFTRQHPSYLQGKSAPTTPGILSRSSSRKHLVGGGLSRKNSLYANENEDDDEDVGYTYAGARDPRRRQSVDSTALPKAKSEATLLPKPHSPTRRYKYQSARKPRTGTSTPAIVDESWLSHAGATASALVQEGKGQSWLAARDVVRPLPAESEEDEDDDQYEEMAALSASTAQLHFAPFEGGSPVSTKRPSRWGSRYGSRSVSRRTSRRGSPTGMRTPRVGDGNAGYFDVPRALEENKAPLEVETEESESEVEIERLGDGSFGLGPMVERFMGFNPFKGEEGVESTDDERGDESLEEAARRRSVELQRRRDAKAKLVAQPSPAPVGDGENGEDVGGWSDAAWLLSVATKAMF